MKWSLVALTLLIFLLVGFLVYLRWGWWVAQPHSSHLIYEAEYLQKRDKLRPLQLLRGSRPFTHQEMEILRQSSRDMSDFRLRCRALTALAYARDPKQREEAVKLATERLKDPNWVVRQYALWALSNLQAKESIPSIVPLLKDPNQKVRQQAKKTLEQLGYKVSE